MVLYSIYIHCGGRHSSAIVMKLWSNFVEICKSNNNFLLLLLLSNRSVAKSVLATKTNTHWDNNFVCHHSAIATEIYFNQINSIESRQQQQRDDSFDLIIIMCVVFMMICYPVFCCNQSAMRFSLFCINLYFVRLEIRPWAKQFVDCDMNSSNRIHAHSQSQKITEKYTKIYVTSTRMTVLWLSCHILINRAKWKLTICHWFGSLFYAHTHTYTTVDLLSHTCIETGKHCCMSAWLCTLFPFSRSVLFPLIPFAAYDLFPDERWTYITPLYDVQFWFQSEWHTYVYIFVLSMQHCKRYVFRFVKSKKNTFLHTYSIRVCKRLTYNI